MNLKGWKIGKVWERQGNKRGEEEKGYGVKVAFCQF